MYYLFFKHNLYLIFFYLSRLGLIHLAVFLLYSSNYLTQLINVLSFITSEEKIETGSSETQQQPNAETESS